MLTLLDDECADEYASTTNEMGVLVSRKMSGMDENTFRHQITCFRKGDVVLVQVLACKTKVKIIRKYVHAYCV